MESKTSKTRGDNKTYEDEGKQSNPIQYTSLNPSKLRQGPDQGAARNACYLGVGQRPFELWTSAECVGNLWVISCKDLGTTNTVS